ncbi:hypothetical protein NA57DRAFT_81159 [Rhizodiscina lignyota]|uniref:MARVEL domain-containing protein n=1 Tax=Rhizodiscina lignyota TaxID=1504668 RepID=A0A9P4I4I4_9PEZI|nr:hypothetical protein NA57DRAFT_81159 [Rhizodiscina lignyota]
MQIVAPILRFVQIVFAAVVLGLSVSLAKGQAPGFSVPATTAYSSFTGGFGMVVALIGLISIFVEFLQGIVMLVLDALASLIFLAGGIAVAIGLRGVSCGNVDEMFKNSLLNGGCTKAHGETECYYGQIPVDRTDQLTGRCRKDEADSAFMFLGFIICAGLVAHTFWFGGRIAGRKMDVHIVA